MPGVSAQSSNQTQQLDSRARNLWYQAVTDHLCDVHQRGPNPDTLREVAAELGEGRAWFELHGAQILTSFEAAQCYALGIASAVRQRPDTVMVSQLATVSVMRLVQD